MPGSIRIGRFRISNRSASVRVGGGPVSYTRNSNFRSRKSGTGGGGGGGGSALGGLLLVVAVIVLLVWIF